MAEGITLLEISFEPAKGINEIIRAAYDAVLHGLRKARARKFHAFKVCTVIYCSNNFSLSGCGKSVEICNELSEET